MHPFVMVLVNLCPPDERSMLQRMTGPVTPAAARSEEDVILEAAYRVEFVSTPSVDPEGMLPVGDRAMRSGELRSLAIADLATRITEHRLLRRADDTARLAALRFVEQRLSDRDKVSAYQHTGLFSSFLRRVLHNLLIDWLRSPTGRAELHRKEHDSSAEEIASQESEPEWELSREEFERNRRLTIHHLVAIRVLKSVLPPGRSIVLRLALWPAYTHAPEDIEAITSFAHCHETSSGQADARGCDTGKRCTKPLEGWHSQYTQELTACKDREPEGLSRKTIALVTRIGVGKSIEKREGAVCERISKGRMQLINELRRAGIQRATA